ncbi:hypothetical protein BC936DRAFT_143536 [Jimgerdemannia flammicorona]|uniref:Potassium channel tetramerisation-type BTB domain-containing protein n=1 Tax=Jimgerdemannia flammicorona TaxID=994334 RepID=A0A432ZYT1_9FUNG|nr:hypothetical protein BC936DRAFT_143536 [Jimgerdemannia flammicorona]
MTERVVFNVGGMFPLSPTVPHPPSHPNPSNTLLNIPPTGLRYETTRTTILTYPDSLLARMLSTENSDMIRFEGVQNNEIFLDRNGKLFEYVLDYYRNGAEIIIPTGVSPKAVERELVYFGFDVSGIVHSFTSGPATSPVPAAIPTSLKAGDCSTISTSTWADEKKNPIILIDDPRAPVPDDGLPSSSFEVMRHSEFLGFNSMGYSLNSRHYFIAVRTYPIPSFSFSSTLPLATNTNPPLPQILRLTPHPSLPLAPTLIPACSSPAPCTFPPRAAYAPPTRPRRVPRSHPPSPRSRPRHRTPCTTTTTKRHR